MLMQNSQQPIGIFDSGMGGLTVAKTITTLMPHEDIIYFGDTAHTPWGDKSINAIQTYALKICDVLLQHHCKVIVIACHTASTTAYELVREHVGHKAHVINVVDPVVHHLQKNHADQKIGLIGTKQTVRSNIYKKRIDMLEQNIDLVSLATPLLVPLIEEGYATREICNIILQEYLSNPVLNDIQALILGCTHYPLLRSFIENFYDPKIDILDASELTASVLKAYLENHNLLNQRQLKSKRIFYLSDHNEFFAHMAKVFFSGDIQLEPYPLWE